MLGAATTAGRRRRRLERVSRKACLLLVLIVMTSETKKNLALYAGGAMAWHALTHAALAITRSQEPHSKLGIRMTPALNAGATLLWAGVSLMLTRYALKARSDTGARENIPDRSRSGRDAEQYAH